MKTPEDVSQDAYQVIGHIAEVFGVFDHPEVQRALDYFGYDQFNEKEILPWPRVNLK